jgi:ligand-binding SRPBCC domain-containing protein
VPSAGRHVFESEQWVPADGATTFAFFADAANLEAITPGFLNFRILTPLPIEMRAGALIEYRLRLMGVPLGWLTRIEDWAPDRAFTDVQLRGPYATWVHRHTFAPLDGGTAVRDRVEYSLPFEPLSAPVHALFVRRTVERIFAHRRIAIARVLGDDDRGRGITRLHPQTSRLASVTGTTGRGD